MNLPNKGKQPVDKYLGWKTLGAFVLAYVVAWIGGAVWGLGATRIGRLLQLSAPLITTLSLSGIAVIQLIVWVLAAWVVLKRRLRALAFQLHHGWWADLLVGVGMTALAILVIFIVGVEAGWLVVEGWVWQTLPFEALLGTLWSPLLINTQVALLEEIACRAYLLTGLREAWGRGAGLAVMTLVFSVLHLPAYDAQGLPLLVLLLPAAAGALFGWAYLRTGSLWLPIGMHFAWDFVENDVLNLSGDITANPHLVGAVTRLQGPLSQAGMGYGNTIVMDTLVLVSMAIGVWLWIRNWQPVHLQRRAGPVGFF